MGFKLRGFGTPPKSELLPIVKDKTHKTHVLADTKYPKHVRVLHNDIKKSVFCMDRQTFICIRVAILLFAVGYNDYKNPCPYLQNAVTIAFFHQYMILVATWVFFRNRFVLYNKIFHPVSDRTIFYTLAFFHFLLSSYGMAVLISSLSSSSFQIISADEYNATETLELAETIHFEEYQVDNKFFADAFYFFLIICISFLDMIFLGKVIYFKRLREEHVTIMAKFKKQLEVIKKLYNMNYEVISLEIKQEGEVVNCKDCGEEASKTLASPPEYSPV